MPQLCSNERMDAMKPKVMEERLRLDRKMKNIRNTFNRSIQMIGRKSKTRVILTEVKRKATSPGQNPVRLKDSRKIKILLNCHQFYIIFWTHILNLTTPMPEDETDSLTPGMVLHPLKTWNERYGTDCRFGLWLRD
jgi:hypothetical protein